MIYYVVNNNDPLSDRQRLDSEDMVDALVEAIDLLGYVIQEHSDYPNTYELLNLKEFEDTPREIDLTNNDVTAEALDMIGYSIVED